MKNFLELAKSRHSVRTYKNKQVEEEKLKIILEAGRIAPTAANLQPCRLLVLDSKESLKKLQKACDPHGAPLAIIVSANMNSVWIRPFDEAGMEQIDASIVTDHMMLCAQDLGLSTCWVTYFNPLIIRKEFNIPENEIPINILVIGYGSEEERPPSRFDDERNPLESIVKYSSY